MGKDGVPVLQNSRWVWSLQRNYTSRAPRDLGYNRKHFKKTTWKTLKKKKIKITRGGDKQESQQPIEIHNHKNARHLLKLIRTKGKENKDDISLTDLNNISKDISRLNKKWSDFYLTNYCIIHSSTQIIWTKWIKEMEDVIISFKEKCYKKKNIRKKDQIKKVLEKRCLDHKENQKRIISPMEKILF